MRAVTVVGNMLIVCMFTVFAAKERNKTHANVTVTTTRRTCALAFAAIVPFTALPAVQAAPQTTQMTTAKLSQAQRKMTTHLPGKMLNAS